MRIATKNLIYLMSASALILSLGVQASANTSELVNSTTPLSDHQYDKNRCDGFKRDNRNIQRDFIAACTTAGLGMTIDICTERLEDCSEDGSEKISYCSNHAITTEEADRAESRTDSLHGDKEDLEMDLVDLAKRRSAVDAKLQATLDSITQGKADALEAEITKMTQITDSIAAQYDKLSSLQLELRKFVLDRSVACHEEAAKVKANFVATRRARAANGQKSYLTQQQLISRTGQSVNARSVIKYNRHMRNCTALGTKKGKQTIFAKQYNFQRATIQNQRRIIKREINRLTAQRLIVKKERTKALLQLDALQASALAQHTRDAENIRLEGIALAAKGARIDNALLLATNKTVHMNNLSSSERNSALISIVLGMNSSTKNKRTVASDSKIEAFTTANSLLLQIEDADRNNNDCDEINNQLESAQNEAPFVTAVDVTASAAGSCTGRGATATRACASE